MLYAPRAAAVGTDERGRPVSVAGLAVEAVKEEWLVEDRWWSGKPVARHYFELVLSGGRCEVVFRELGWGGRWFAQRG